MNAFMKRRSTGFSLVEVVVGLAIGMISMTIIMQVFSVFEGGKRTATAGADAQNNGAIALYMIEQDARMAGWGMDTSIYANCNSAYSYCDGSAVCGGSAGPLSDLSFTALKVTDGGAGPDTLSAQYYSDPDISTFRLPGNTSLRSSMPQSSSELNVGSVSGCEVGDMVLVAQAGSCTLMQITQIQDQALKIQHNPGSSGPFNPPANYQNSNNWPAYTTGARLSCFKPPSNGALFKRTYSVNTTTRQLMLTNDEGTQPTVPEIFDLQVQYGVAPAGSQDVNDWVDASGTDWANPTNVNARRIKAVRVALVARSTQYEKPESGPCITTTQEMVDDWSTWAVFNTANYPSDWQCYRYKVFETVVPLRNVIWGNL